MVKIKEQEIGISPAALTALANGDFGNFLVASIPGGIEAQERAGQLEQAQKETLPLDLRHGQCHDASCTDDMRKPWEALGFKFGKPIDTVFVEATFPKGWKKRPTDHSMWSEIIDEKGRKRGTIFYKAAFYDRSAIAYLEPRFSVQETYKGPKVLIIVDACGEVTREIAGEDPSKLEGDAFHKAYRENNEKREKLVAWLNEHYPEWENPTAYWF